MSFPVSGWSKKQAEIYSDFLQPQVAQKITSAVEIEPWTVNECNASSGAFTVTLPPVQNNMGVHLWVIKTDSGGNSITIDGNGSEEINGSTTQTLTSQYDVAHLYCSGENWWIL